MEKKTNQDETKSSPLNMARVGVVLCFLIVLGFTASPYALAQSFQDQEIENKAKDRHSDFETMAETFGKKKNFKSLSIEEKAKIAREYEAKRKQKRAERLKQRTLDVSTLNKNIQPITRALSDEERRQLYRAEWIKHTQRMAIIERLTELGQKRPEKTLARKAEALRAMEDRRHAREHLRIDAAPTKER